MRSPASNVPTDSQDARRVRQPRIPEMFPKPSDRRFGTLAALPSNIEAIEAGLLFASHLRTFVAIVGPTGWGKSHLLDSASFRLAQDMKCPPPVIPALDWLNHPRTDAAAPLLLDDVQDAVARTRSRLQLQLALERRVRAGRPTILAFTAPGVTRQLRGFLPAQRDWVVATIGEPQPTERLLIINQMATLEGLTLSTALTQLLAFRMKGNGRTLSGALKRLRLNGSHWVDVHATLRACGILEPFFADCCDWDLKERIVRTSDELASRFPGVPLEDLTVYIMLRQAGFPEADIARYFRIEASEVYTRAARFQTRCDACEGSRACVAQFVETVVDGILYD